MSLNQHPRIFVSLIGNVESEAFARVKYGFFLNALQKKYDLVIQDATLRGADRLWNAMQVFSPNRRLWKERFYQNNAAFQMRSKKVAAAIQSHTDQIDIILQIGTLFDSGWQNPGKPVLIYTDYTSMLSSKKPDAGRSPYRGKALQERLALEKQAFEHASAICTRGKNVRDSVINDYGISEDKVFAIGSGVNMESLPVITHKPIPSAPTALFIGKDFYRKGGDILLQAFQKVRQEIHNARLLMLTEGSIPAGLDLTGVEVISPTWDRSKIMGFYEQADCFVLPSRLETWGDVLLEAMAFGLPCIGVWGEAMEDIIQDGQTGLLVPPDDPNSLSEALIQLFSNQALRQEYSLAARKRVETLFTWEIVVERISVLIENDKLFLDSLNERS